MREQDFDAFSSMLDDVAGMYPKGAVSTGQKAMYFRALAAFPLEEVRAGFDCHVRDPQRGRFMPLPADVIAQIDGLVADDGRPGAEEAWALALRSVDEAETVVWTKEAAEAWGSARMVLEAGDEVGARMAFKEVYGRLMERARKARAPVVWSASLGFDLERRRTVLLAAAEAGRISHADVPELPAPSSPLLLEMSAPSGMPPETREALIRLGQKLAAKQLEPSAAELDRARTHELKARAAALVQSKTTEVAQ